MAASIIVFHVRNGIRTSDDDVMRCPVSCISKGCTTRRTLSSGAEITHCAAPAAAPATETTHVGVNGSSSGSSRRSVSVYVWNKVNPMARLATMGGTTSARRKAGRSCRIRRPRYGTPSFFPCRRAMTSRSENVEKCTGRNSRTGRWNRNARELTHIRAKALAMESMRLDVVSYSSCSSSSGRMT